LPNLPRYFSIIFEVDILCPDVNAKYGIFLGANLATIFPALLAAPLPILPKNCTAAEIARMTEAKKAAGLFVSLSLSFFSMNSGRSCFSSSERVANNFSSI